jgi:hypothetical protein
MALLTSVRRNFLTEIFNTSSTYSLSLHSGNPGQVGSNELTIPFGGSTSVTFAPRFNFKFQHVTSSSGNYPSAIEKPTFKNDGSIDQNVTWFCIWDQNTFLYSSNISLIVWKPDQTLKFDTLALI